MVTTDISQLVGECGSWVNTLRAKRNDFTKHKDNLQQIALQIQDADSLKSLEHLQNQFYIQLINIHDIKHDIKGHEQIAQWEIDRKGQVTDATIAAHEELLLQFEQLMGRLDLVEEEFDQFVAAAH